MENSKWTDLENSACISKLYLIRKDKRNNPETKKLHSAYTKYSSILIEEHEELFINRTVEGLVEQLCYLDNLTNGVLDKFPDTDTKYNGIYIDFGNDK